MGYSVPEHFAALQRLGPTIHHRRSFSPVAVADGLKAPPVVDDPALGLPALGLPL
jgi:ribonuclease HII